MHRHASPDFENSDDPYPIRVVQQVENGRLSYIILAIAGFACTALVALGGYGLYKISDLSERMARMEAMMSMLLERKHE